MEMVKSIAVLRELVLKFRTTAVRAGKGAARVGFVPTMGYLHEGHASLMRTARTQCDLVVASVFVNPYQFGPNEDFNNYPRDLEGDRQLAKQCGVDIVFMPDLIEMFPEPSLTTVSVSNITAIMCGTSRPGHFDSVSTVVTKLFNIVKPDYAYFGMKDAQQVAVVEQMVADLSMDVNIVRCPTIREKDNLAMSSRNVHLTKEERQQSIILFKALEEASMLAQKDGMTFGNLAKLVKARICSMPLAVPVYVEVAYYPSMKKMDQELLTAATEQSFIVALAVQFGKARLIDNRIIDPKDFT